MVIYGWFHFVIIHHLNGSLFCSLLLYVYCIYAVSSSSAPAASRHTTTNFIGFGKFKCLKKSFNPILQLHVVKMGLYHHHIWGARSNQLLYKIKIKIRRYYITFQWIWHSVIHNILVYFFHFLFLFLLSHNINIYTLLMFRITKSFHYTYTTFHFYWVLWPAACWLCFQHSYSCHSAWTNSLYAQYSTPHSSVSKFL